MIRQVAVLRNRRGCLKGTLMKAPGRAADFETAELGLAPVQTYLTACFDVSLFAAVHFQAQTAFRPEPWLHQVRT